MMLAKDLPADEIDVLLAHIGERVARNRSIHRRLPGGGRLHVDRPLPFLCAHRATADAFGEATARLVTTQAAYLRATADPGRQVDLARLCAGYIRSITEQMGALLLLEIWAAQPAAPRDEQACDPCRQPAFRIVVQTDALPTVVETLRESLAEISLSGLPAEVEVSQSADVAPPGLPPLAPVAEAAAGGFVIGLEVRPIYFEPHTGRLYPLVLKMLRSRLSMALKRAFCAFAGMKLETPPAHFEALGPRAILQAVGSADRRLCEVADQFDFVLHATPVNAHQQGEEFRRRRGDYSPKFVYRPLPFNPHLLKRELFKIRLENIDDPTLALLLSERHQELDRQITMLADRGTANFLYGSLQVYGTVEDWLLELARQLIVLLPARERGRRDEWIGARELALLAEAEFDRYRGEGEFKPTLEFRDDIASGVMISRDRLLISTDMQVAVRRVPALLHHEIGTHLVTYFNGLSQPLRQLSTGLAGYETLQEGLAVLSEYLCGGLSNDRLRTLAARVMACHAVTQGASFVETCRLLRAECGLRSQVAFTTTVRAHRSGGLTKDAIYLRGLHELLQYLRDGHRLEPLLVGKIALRHVPFLRELRRREIVRAAPLRPHYLDEPEAIRRLEACRTMTVLELASAPNAWDDKARDDKARDDKTRKGKAWEGEAPAEPGSG